MSKRGYLSAFTKSFKKILVNIADFIRKFQTIIRIIVLLSGLGAFSIIGGLLFKVVESPREQLSIEVTRDVREKTLEQIFKIFDRAIGSRRQLDDYGVVMVEYEGSYVKAIKNGTTFVNGKPHPLWTFEGSTYFCVTTFAQLGFGNLAPKSLLGRFVSILYACFSIPFGAIVFADLGDQINKLITVSYSMLYAFFKNLKEAADEDIEKYEKLKMGMKMLSKKAKKKAEQKEKEKKGLMKAVRRLANLNATLRRGGRTEMEPVGQDLEEEEDEEEEEDMRSGTRNRNYNNQIDQTIPQDRNCYKQSFRFQNSSTDNQLRLRHKTNCSGHIPPSIHHGSIVDNGIPPTPKPFQSKKNQNANNVHFNSRFVNQETQTNTQLLQTNKMTSSKNMFELLAWSPACPLIVRIALFRNKLSDRLKLRKLANKRNALKRNGATNNSNVGGGGDESDEEDEDDEEEGSDIVDDMGGEQVPVVIISILLVIAYVILGTYIITKNEDWNYTDSAWFLIMSVLTVGYGDITPHDEEFFAFFIAYLILGMAIASNVISMSMKFLTTVTTQLSNIAKDMYITTNARSKFHHIRRTGLRARRWWLVVRHHVMSGLPRTLTEESRIRKNRLIESEKELIKRAFRIYYQKQFEQQLEQIQADDWKVKCPQLLAAQAAALSKRPTSTIKEVVAQVKQEPMYPSFVWEGREREEKATQTERTTLWFRMKRGTKNKYENLRNALSPGADYF